MPSASAGRARDIVVFSKSGCHLCEAVERELRSMGAVAAELKVVDIDADPGLHEAYWLRVPVVRVDGRDVFEAKMMDPGGGWRRVLPRLLGAS